MDVNQQPGAPSVGVGCVGGVPGWKKPHSCELQSLEITSEQISIQGRARGTVALLQGANSKGCSSCAASATENLHLAWLG